VLFYNLDYYIQNPLDIVMLRDGGMAFHGGFLGMGTTIILVARYYRIPVLALADCAALAVPPGLFLGRMANFINGELYGRVTDAPWGMVFPGGGPLLRHPSQIYEALLEGVLLLGVLIIIWQKGGRQYQGLITGTFIAGYGLSRIIVEFFRQPDDQLGFLIVGTTMGQWLSLPMVLAGVILICYALRRA
jgi:phosphatidylglycerol:prolipoprotein diacylglycerol transferase